MQAILTCLSFYPNICSRPEKKLVRRFIFFSRRFRSSTKDPQYKNYVQNSLQTNSRDFISFFNISYKILSSVPVRIARRRSTRDAAITAVWFRAPLVIERCTLIYGAYLEINLHPVMHGQFPTFGHSTFLPFVDYNDSLSVYVHFSSPFFIFQFAVKIWT